MLNDRISLASINNIINLLLIGCEPILYNGVFFCEILYYLPTLFDVITYHLCLSNLFIIFPCTSHQLGLQILMCTLANVFYFLNAAYTTLGRSAITVLCPLGVSSILV